MTGLFRRYYGNLSPSLESLPASVGILDTRVDIGHIEIQSFLVPLSVR